MDILQLLIQCMIQTWSWLLRSVNQINTVFSGLELLTVGKLHQQFLSLSDRDGGWYHPHFNRTMRGTIIQQSIYTNLLNLILNFQ